MRVWNLAMMASLVASAVLWGGGNDAKAAEWIANFEAPDYAAGALVGQQGWSFPSLYYSGSSSGEVVTAEGGARARFGAADGSAQTAQTPGLPETPDGHFRAAFTITPGSGGDSVIRLLNNWGYNTVCVVFENGSGLVKAAGYHNDGPAWSVSGFSYTPGTSYQVIIDRDDNAWTFDVWVNGGLILKDVVSCADWLGERKNGGTVCFYAGSGDSSNPGRYTYIDQLTTISKPIIWKANFEAPDYTTGALAGQQNWSIPGLYSNRQSGTVVAFGTGQQVRFGATDGFGQTAQSPALKETADGHCRVAFTLIPGSGGDSLIRLLNNWGSSTVCVRFERYTGLVWAAGYHNDYQNWSISNFAFTPGTSYRVMIDRDDNDWTFDLWINGVMVLGNVESCANWLGDQKNGGMVCFLADSGCNNMYIDDVAEVKTAPAVFSPKGPEITGGTEITMTSETLGAKIYYTTDGATPTTSSAVYSTPVPVTVGTVLKAMAVMAEDSSEITSQTYTYPKTATPVFSPNVRYITESTVSVTMSSTTLGATIHYTTDNSTPTSTSASYTGKITVPAGTTVKAIAIAEGHTDSDLAGITYTLPPTYSRPAAIPAGTVTVDGDLSDWAGVTWTPLDQAYDTGGSTVEALNADIPEAYYAARWQADRVYVAVRVRDTAHYFTDSFSDWNVRDAVEIYFYTNNNGPVSFPFATSAQQYTFGFRASTPTQLWGELTNQASGGRDIPVDGSFPGIAAAAGNVDGQWLNYEVAIVPYAYFGLQIDGTLVPATLKPGDVLGLDVCAVGNNNGAYTGMKSENMMVQKFADYTRFGLHELVTLPGDANGDGHVTFADFSILQNNYNGSGRTWSQGDFNGDKQVTFEDFSILQNHFGQSAGADQAPAAAGTVPTGLAGGCAPLGLLLLGAIGLASLPLNKQE